MGNSSITGIYVPEQETLYQSNTAVSTQSTTTNNVILTNVLSGLTVGKNDSIRIEHYWTKTGTAGTMNVKIRFSAAWEVFVKTAIGATNQSLPSETTIMMNNSLTAQKAYNKSRDTVFGVTTSTMETGTVDTNNSVDIEFIAWCGVGTDTISLESYRIIHLRAPE